MEVESTRMRELAKQFALNTNQNLFLTGKAGTGKTTLLKEILKETDKQCLVAAPTGVAAINAGGVTLHSLFLLPLRAFIPEPNPTLNPDVFCDASDLVKNQKFRRDKLDLFLQLEMLVIDEISMVRVDLLEAIDYTLRRVRKNAQPFGGVQIMAIGDLYQLPPVVKNDVEGPLSNYYKGFYFFGSPAWQRSQSVTIELDRVYRQEDEEFIDLLNAIRNGIKDHSVIDKINERYSPSNIPEEVITLTTHVRQATEINQSKLGALNTDIIKFSADINGKFPENSYPVGETIELKKGAQVMFVRNHPDGLYFNGKIGIISKISESSITVKTLDDNQSILVEMVEWTIFRYELDESTDKIIKNEVGSFTQYPLRLAWAVTVHKSQGLTFDRVVLDLERTFAAGQLYVALSRCRSLDGMYLLSEIKTQNIITDLQVISFYSNKLQVPQLTSLLEAARIEYEQYQIIKSFNVAGLLTYLDPWQEILKEKEIMSKGNCQKLIFDIRNKLTALENVATKFHAQLKQIFDSKHDHQDLLLDRLQKAIEYYTEQLHNDVYKPLVKHGLEYSIKKNTKAYVSTVGNMEIAVAKQIKNLYHIKFLDKEVYESEKTYLTNTTSANKKKRQPKGNTVEITLEMHKEGKSLNLIAKERGLAVSTIESHMAQLITAQKVSVYDLMDSKKVEKALAVAQSYPDLNLTDLIKKVPFKIGFGKLRWIVNYRNILES